MLCTQQNIIFYTLRQLALLVRPVLTTVQRWACFFSCYFYKVTPLADTCHGDTHFPSGALFSSSLVLFHYPHSCHLSQGWSAQRQHKHNRVLKPFQTRQRTLLSRTDTLIRYLSLGPKDTQQYSLFQCNRRLSFSSPSSCIAPGSFSRSLGNNGIDSVRSSPTVCSFS